MIRASIIGATGYTAIELLNIFRQHPEIKVSKLVSHSNSGKSVVDLYPELTAYKDYKYESLNYTDIANNSDIVFTALPHGSSAEAVSEFAKLGVKVIDLSADYRYNNVKLYESTYKLTHPHKNLKATYGLPELFRNKIKSSDLIANPGCYTTCSIVPLYPLLKENLIDTNNIIINAASGVSGAGRKADLTYNFCEVDSNYKAYAVINHRHTTEIEEKLSMASGSDINVQFTPHLLPIQRGILSTIYLNPIQDNILSKIKDVYSSYYKKEEFIVVDDDKMPSINQVKYSNYLRIGYTFNEKTNKIIVVSCLDNLIKGASGQAVQNMNIIFDIKENTGLTNQPYHI